MTKEQWAQFSPTQQVLIAHVATGKSNEEISNIMKLHTQTVKWHLTRIYKLMDWNRYSLIHDVLKAEYEEKLAASRSNCAHQQP